jgi:PleD family two-component response regulator
VSSSEQPVIQQQQQVQLLKEADRNLLLQSSVERLEGRSAMDQAVPRERQGHCETKIILAEDEVLVRIVLADALRREGFQVIEAIDADDAIKH